MLTTYLEWLSRQTSLETEYRDRCGDLAKSLCEEGLRLASAGYEHEQGNHPWCLLMLTSVSLDRTRSHLLDRVASGADIIDENQRARVYRKLGLLYRKAGKRMKGFGWGVRALLVPGPMAVRLKSLAALVGFDR